MQGVPRLDSKKILGFFNGGSIKGTTISGNDAPDQSGGLWEDSAMSATTLQIGKTSGNTAPPGSNAYGTATYV
jgi:hypothetical protein